MTATLAPPAVQIALPIRRSDQQGQTVSGFVNALTLADATKMLRTEGEYIIDLKAARAGELLDTAGNTIPGRSLGGSRVKREEVIAFTIQLSVMVDAGVPLSDGLTALSEQTVSPAFSAVLKVLVADVQGGKDFSSSLEKHPKVFPKYYTSLVKASEMSGTMGNILRRLADYLVSQRAIAKKVRGALIYPAFMFVMSISVTVFLLIAVLPRFTAIFASRKAALPMPTQVLIFISDSLVHYWVIWLAAVLAIIISGSWYLPTKSGRRAMDYVKLHIPLFSGMFHKLYLSRSLQTIGTMIQSGVQMMDCLAIVRDVSGNSYYSELWHEVREKIQQGSQLSDPLMRSKLVPRAVSQMIHSGEKTGELPNVMNRIAAYMEEDLRTSIKTTTQFIEPVMIGLMGILIGGVAIAMLLPILTISKVMAN